METITTCYKTIIQNNYCFTATKQLLRNLRSTVGLRRSLVVKVTQCFIRRRIEAAFQLSASICNICIYEAKLWILNVHFHNEAWSLLYFFLETEMGLCYTLLVVYCKVCISFSKVDNAVPMNLSFIMLQFTNYNRIYEMKAVYLC